MLWPSEKPSFRFKKDLKSNEDMVADLFALSVNVGHDDSSSFFCWISFCFVGASVQKEQRASEERKHSTPSSLFYKNVPPTVPRGYCTPRAFDVRM